MEENAVSVVAKNQTGVAHRSLVWATGMLAAPTDMGHSLRQIAQTAGAENRPGAQPCLPLAHRLQWRKKGPPQESRLGNTEAAKTTVWLSEEKPGRYAVGPQFSRRQRIAALGVHRTKLNVVRWQHKAASREKADHAAMGTIRARVRL